MRAMYAIIMLLKNY